MTLYAVEQPLLSGGWLLREREDDPLVEQIRVLLDVIEREQIALPGWLQAAFEPWLTSTKGWIDDPASAADDEVLREILDRLRRTAR